MRIFCPSDNISPCPVCGATKGEFCRGYVVTYDQKVGSRAFISPVQGGADNNGVRKMTDLEIIELAARRAADTAMSNAASRAIRKFADEISKLVEERKRGRI